MGRDLLLPDASAGRATVLGRIFRSRPRARCARPPQMPRREWIGALGMRRLRLHGEAGREAEDNRNAVYRRTTFDEERKRPLRDPAAADHHVSFVENRGLSRSDRALGLIECHQNLIAARAL